MGADFLTRRCAGGVIKEGKIMKRKKADIASFFRASGTKSAKAKNEGEMEKKQAESEDEEPPESEDEEPPESSNLNGPPEDPPPHGAPLDRRLQQEAVRTHLPTVLL
ncbi:unnamed protein product [Boreogadus saida]